MWWSTNLLLAMAMISVVYAGGWEYSVRQYLKGFSDAIVPTSVTPEQKTEAILDWMRRGPMRTESSDLADLPSRDPEVTLNYRQLLAVCGTATNAFLNLARSADLSVRRLLLLTPERTTKHVVAEVLIDGQWVIVDPAYRVLMRDLKGHLLTRNELGDPRIFAEATRLVPNYRPEYTYENFAHVRFARLPMEGLHLRKVLETISPRWDAALDWTLLLERESFFVLSAATVLLICFLMLRFLLGWYTDHHLKVPRFRLRDNLFRAGETLFSAPESK